MHKILFEPVTVSFKVLLIDRVKNTDSTFTFFDVKLLKANFVGPNLEHSLKVTISRPDNHEEAEHEAWEKDGVSL